MVEFLKAKSQHLSCTRILFSFIAYTSDDLCQNWKLFLHHSTVWISLKRGQMSSARIQGGQPRESQLLGGGRGCFRPPLGLICPPEINPDLIKDMIRGAEFRENYSMFVCDALCRRNSMDPLQRSHPSNLVETHSTASQY